MPPEKKEPKIMLHKNYRNQKKLQRVRGSLTSLYNRNIDLGSK